MLEKRLVRMFVKLAFIYQLDGGKQWDVLDIALVIKVRTIGSVLHLLSQHVARTPLENYTLWGENLMTLSPTSSAKR